MTPYSNISNYSLEQNTFQVFGPQRDSLYIVWPITIIYSIEFTIGLLGNILFCFVIIQNKKLHSATNIYLFSLAISDLLLLVSGMPQEIYSIWSKWPYVFGNVFCVLRGLPTETSTNASILTITLFTIERYIAICHPFLSYQISSFSRAIKLVILIWTVSLGLALLQALQFGVVVSNGVTMCLQSRVIIKYLTFINFIVLFLIPMIIIGALYALIGLKLYRSIINPDSFENNELHRNSTQLLTFNIKQRAQSTKRVIKMLVAVVITFFICWTPFHAQRIVAIYTSEYHLSKSSFLLSVYSFLKYTSGVFHYLSTCINPIIYNSMSNNFRDAFKDTMMQLCCKNTRQPIAQRCTYTTVAISQNVNRDRSANSGNSLKKEDLNMDLFNPCCKRQDNPNVKSSGDEKLCEQCTSTFAGSMKNDDPRRCTHELHITLPDTLIELDEIITVSTSFQLKEFTEVAI